MREADLLAAIRDAPDDDAPRLVWADAVGGERGELVVLQCDLARGDLPPAETAARRRRVDELLAAHGAAWSGLAGHATRCVFRRGFVATAEIEAATLAARVDAIRAAAPLLTAVNVRGLEAEIDYRESTAVRGPDAVAVLERVFAAPGFGALRAVDLRGANVTTFVGDSEWDIDSLSLDDRVLELIAASGKLGGLRAFGFGDPGGGSSRGTHELVGSNVLVTLERLELRSETPPDAVAAIVRGAPRLRALALRCRLLEYAAVLPPTLVELAAYGYTDDDVAALAASPAAASLERLRLGIGQLDAADVFAAFPRLRALDLEPTLVRSDDHRSRALARELVRARLPALRELRPFRIDEAALEVVVDGLGAQLARLDCRGLVRTDLAASLAPGVAGDLVVGPWAPSETLIEDGVHPREPWLGYGLVAIPA